MSSSTSYPYAVEQDALRREQERRAAEDALHSAERRYAELRMGAEPPARRGRRRGGPGGPGLFSGELDRALALARDGLDPSTSRADLPLQTPPSEYMFALVRAP